MYRAMRHFMTCVIVYSACAQWSAAAQSPSHPAGVIECMMRQPATEQRMAVCARSYETLFKTSSPQSLLSHRNTGIALRASWEQVRQAMRERGSTEIIRIDKNAVERFLRFAERRLDIDLPEAWLRLLPDSYYSSSPPELIVNTSASDDGGNADLRKVTSTDVRGYLVTVPRPATFKAGEDAFRITADGKSCTVPLALVERDLESFGELIVNVVPFGACQAIVAMHSRNGEPYSLYCLDRNAGTVVWNSKLWCERPSPGGSSGYQTHFVDIRIEGDTAYVFGTCSSSIYLEAFLLSSGANLFRFSTSF